MLFRALAIWCGLLMAAFVNGALRVVWLAPAFGDSIAHVISAVVLSAIVAASAWLAIVWLHPDTANEALLIGDEWVLLTVGFEVLAGYYFIGTWWHRLLMEYNVSQGEMWEIVLVTMLVAPTVARIGHRRELRLAGRWPRVSLGAHDRTWTISSMRKAFFGR